MDEILRVVNDIKSGFVGGAILQIYRPKTVDIIQDVFAADGDMALVPAP